MNDKTRFEDFLFRKWKTICIEHLRNGDTIYCKDFTKNGKKYCIITRFSGSGGYCHGYLTDEDGIALVDGYGFMLTTFIDHLSIALKSI